MKTKFREDVTDLTNRNRDNKEKQGDQPKRAQKW